MAELFDDISRIVVQLPRRKALRLIGTALVGSALAPFGVGRAWAKQTDDELSECLKKSLAQYLKGLDECAKEWITNCRFPDKALCNEFYGICANQKNKERMARDKACACKPKGHGLTINGRCEPSPMRP